LALVVVGVSVSILGYFYKYSHKSKADSDKIAVEFSTNEILLDSQNSSSSSNILLLSPDQPLVGATVLVNYPKDIVDVQVDNSDSCSDIELLFSSNIDEDEGTIIITKIAPDTQEILPQGIICFAKIIFSKTADGSGAVTFADGPLGNRSWEIVGENLQEYAPSYADQSINITVSDSGVTPSPSEIPTYTPSPSPDPSITDAPTASPTPGSTQTSRKVDFSIKLQGVTKIPRNTGDIPVVISFVRDEEIVDTRSTIFKVQPDGSWKGSGQYDNLLSGVDYLLLIKGPKHLQKKICVARPNEAISGHYSCQTGSIRVENGDTNFDMTGIMLLAGDLPVQNGIIDAVDIIYIRNNLGSKDPEVVSRADLNYDEIVDSQDYTIIINALSFKYDELE